jgi:hypothetical protein
MALGRERTRAVFPSPILHRAPLTSSLRALCSVYFSVSALAHAKVVSNTSFSNGFISEVFFQNELEGMSQKKVAHPASAHVIFAQ